MHFTTWPDRGVPASTKEFLTYLHAVGAKYQRAARSATEDKILKTPLLVHCSAGVGRTGTLRAW